ncbi:outer membrane beta-barrel family protein [Emticicia agri]|uniref:TonB-dependent receptor n=1 Tax=Emticicia agri TaxID=2492393 RepID=A0A4Q5LVJ3_9BACT|nr:outer membrane beta-barrel family protein [Emticicia agri]RYU93761.1 TonB-dependent receptor [Emticicia agri]
MKKLLLSCMLALAGLLLCTYVHAQNGAKGQQITGVLVDSLSQKNPDFITVALMKDKNVSVKVDYSKADGSFRFVGLKPAKYYLVISGVGYKGKTLSADLSDSTKTILNLGKIFITEEALGLKEVKVSATKQIVKQEVDRISYDTQADPESKVFSVLDMMRKVPYLSLDAEDNIQLKGNSDFRILINGKPSSMVERSYKDILRSMPASSIQRIEVITTPPSKYDAEGLSGIINIITNKNVTNGYNGSLNVSERFPVGGPGIGGSLSAKIGKWGLSAFGGANLYKNPQTATILTRNTFGESSTLLDQRGFNKSENKSGYLGLEISYELDSLNLISGQFNINGNRNDAISSQSSDLTKGSEILQRYYLNNVGDGTGSGFDAALNYQLGFKADKNRLLTLSYRYYGFDSGQDNVINISERINYDLPNYRQLNDQLFSEHTIQVDYVHPIKKLMIEAGMKGILRNNKSNFEYRTYNSDTDNYQILEELSNKFSNTQNIYGIYNTYQYNFKKWGVKAGVRVEQTVLDANFATTNSKVSQNYFNVIPTISINRKFKKSGLNFGYTQRIRRPNIYQLNPFVDRSNPNFERTGNPNLRPSVLNDINIGYNWSGKSSFSLSVGHTFIKDMFFPVIVYDPATGITRSSFGNVGKAKLLPMVMVNFNHPITKKWNMSINPRMAYAMTEGIINGKLIKNKGLMYGANLSSGYRLEKNWRVNVNINYNGPNINIQEKTNHFFGYSASVNKDVVKDKLSFSASFNNPFNKFRRNIRDSFGPDFLQYNEQRNYFRTFNFSLNYKFGKLKESIKKNKRGIRNDDVQGGEN